MGKLLTCAGVLAALVAVMAGGLLSGKFAEMGLLASGIDLLERNGFPNPVGLVPAFVHKEAPRWSVDQVPAGSLNGKFALVTGANIGLGKEHSLQLAVKGAQVVVACRSKDKCDAAAKEINAAAKAANSKGSAVPMIVDQSSFASVKAFLKKFKANFDKLDIFVMNAGIVAGPYEITADGLEKVFHTNHVGAFQMLMGLKPIIESTAAKSTVRIVAISSASHYDGELFGVPSDLDAINKKENYFKYDRYGLTKLANVLVANEIPKRFSGDIISTSCHPGAVGTAIWEQAGGVIEAKVTSNPTVKKYLLSMVHSIKEQFMWSVPDGALTQIYLSTLATKEESGKYFHPIVREVTKTPRARNPQESKDLWDFSLKLVQGQY